MFRHVHLPIGKWNHQSSLSPKQLRRSPSMKLWIALALLLLLTACAPVHSPKNLVGTWRADSPCGNEILELHTDSTYTQRVLKSKDNVDTHEGRWTVVPPEGRLSGANVVLHGPVHLCLFSKQKTTDELSLDVEWEWGRTVLLWNPDEPGYEKLR